MTAINHHTVVHSVNASRAESGTYLLRLTNDSGSDEGEEHSVQSRARVTVSNLPGVQYRRDVFKYLHRYRLPVWIFINVMFRADVTIRSNESVTVPPR